MASNAIQLPKLHQVYKPHSNGEVTLYIYRSRGGERIGSYRGANRRVVNELAKQDAVRLTAAYATKPKIQPGADISYLIKRYMSAPDGFQKLAATTQRNWRSAFKYIDLEIGTLKLDHLKAGNARSVLKAWRNKRADTPRTADYYIQVLSALFAWGIEEELVSANPLVGMRKLYKVDRSDVIVEPDELKRILPLMTREAALAVRFAAATGIRRGDLVDLRWSEVKEDCVEFDTNKSTTRRTVMVIPLVGDALSVMNEIRAINNQKVRSGVIPSAYVFTSRSGAAWKPDSLTNAFGRAMKAAGVKGKDLHDLRGTAATRYAKMKVSNEDIAIFLGWEVDRVDRIIARYVSRKSRGRGALDRLASHAKTA